MAIITNADNTDYLVEYQYVIHRSDRRYRMTPSPDSQSMPVAVHCCDHVSLSVYIKPLCYDLLDCYVTTINSPQHAGTCFTVYTPTIIVNNTDISIIGRSLLTIDLPKLNNFKRFFDSNFLNSWLQTCPNIDVHLRWNNASSHSDRNVISFNYKGLINGKM